MTGDSTSGERGDQVRGPAPIGGPAAGTAVVDGPEAADGTGIGHRLRWGRAAAAALLTVVLIGVPTDIVANPWFGREIPVRWWEYPVLALTAVLTGLWFAIQLPPKDRDSAAPALSGAALALFAVGCPVCNKLVLLAIGTSGALGFWAPIQPYLAVLSLVFLAAAVAYRWRRRDCGPACAV